ncbi:MAG: aminoacyl-tRNA hydrolase [Clostridia bacterium]|nr:aminoacyl-tRNA hydrolase [Clostridia bacterium]
MVFGNPGKEYERTRHNVGFRAIDLLAEKLNIEMTKKKFDAIVGENIVENEKIMLVKPQTYMNLSGVCVSEIVDFYKLDMENLIVIYDDIDIELGKIRLRKSGSPGTHNGMRNITQMLASEEFPRIRIGTDKPKFQMNLADYVLMPFSKEEDEIVKKGIENAASATIKIISAGIQTAMNEFNGK